MAPMSIPSRRRTEAPPEFASVVKALYGDVVDAQEVWDEVLKGSPDQADVHARTAGGGNLRRNVERASNAVGITAGSLGLAAAMKDPRLASGGKVARALYKTGQKMPSVADKIATSKPRLAGALAAGAVGTQVANLGGDALIAGTLGQGQGKQKQNVGKSLVLVPTGEVTKAFGLPKLEKVVEGVRSGWKAMIPTRTPAATPHQATLPGLEPSKVPTAAGQKARAAGRDISTALGTKSGKVMAGTLAGGAAVSGARSARARSRGVDYAPDGVYKAAVEEVDVEFGGTFSKFDDDKKQVFGWASVTKINGQPVVDRQGDYIDLGDLEDAAYAYVHKSRVGGDMHKRTQSLQGDSAHKVSDMIESMVFTPDKIAKMGLPADFPQGWWVGYQVHDPETWDLVKKRGRTGFSIHGKGIRKAMDLDELMGYTR